MPSTDLCPHCRQPMRHERLGVFLTQRESEIFDKIKRFGNQRVQASVIGSPTQIKVHVFNINSKLLETDWRIDGRQGRDGGYMLVRRRVAIHAQP